MSSPHMGMYAPAMGPTMHSPPPTSPSAMSPQDGSQGVVPLPHPYLQHPILYVSGLNPAVSDADLARALEFCVPFRPSIMRDGSGRPASGTLEFKTIDKAEKALATLQARPIPGINPPALLHLSPLPPTNPPTMMPPPSAQARLVKQLPAGYTDSMLYDLFRQFGSLASARTQAGFGKDVGVVEFWREEDARVAEESMQYAEVGGQMISVQIYHPRRTGSGPGEFSPTAPPFIPSAGASPYHGHIPLANHYSPPRAPSLYSQPRSPTIPMGSFVHGPGQQVQYAPLHGPGSTSSSGLIDPCNLFCKNLDPEIDSNGLFTHFRPYGQIVSARVMRNDNGQSRGFGFVSFQTPEQAAAALHAMNGAVLGSKQLVVRLHEPKQLRQEKLMQRYASGGHNGHPRSSSGATSPTPSEGGDSYAAWGAHPHTAAYGPSHTTPDRDRGRRGSGSYFNAALSGSLNLPMRYEELYALSPVVRKEVLTGELSRRIKTLETVSVPVNQVDAIVESIASLALGEVVAGIHDPTKLADQVRTAQTTLSNGSSRPASQPQTRSTSQTRSQDSRVLDPNLLNATASAPEHPSTPVSSFSPAISTPPRTSSPSPSVALPPTASEKDRLVALVAKLEGHESHEIVDMLLSLSKKERALCLFNLDYLKGKVREAKEVLEVLSQEADEPPAPVKTNGSVKTAVPTTPQSKQSLPSPDQTPETRSASGASSNASNATVHTLATLARLSAAEIVRLASSPSATGLPLPKADPVVVQATNDFIDGVMSRPGPQQKQVVGEKLFKVIKAFGIKNSPKVTIALLDSEDLRALAHLMNSYPTVLKEKVLLQTAVVVK